MVLLVLQAVHLVGLALDEVLFPGYRRIAVRCPVMILGTPRSGTTFLHRLLAHDDRLTTFSTWECALAPSISERYVWTFLVRLDRTIGSPFARIAGLIERRAKSKTRDVHPIGLSAPEEDYFVLMPRLLCFVLIVPFPESLWLWRFARFDETLTVNEKRTVMRYYRRCLQRHLYFHGPDKTMLSKNAAFAGMARTLATEFPDARFVICERDPIRALASQIRSLKPSLRFFRTTHALKRIESRLVDCFDFYYRNLDRARALVGPSRSMTVTLWNLSRHPRDTLKAVYSTLGIELPTGVDGAIAAYEASPVEQPHTKPRPENGTADWRQRFSDRRHAADMRI